MCNNYSLHSQEISINHLKKQDTKPIIEEYDITITQKSIIDQYSTNDFSCIFGVEENKGDFNLEFEDDVYSSDDEFEDIKRVNDDNKSMVSNDTSFKMAALQQSQKVKKSVWKQMWHKASVLNA